MSASLRLAQQARAMFEQADRENRDLTDAERGHVDGLLQLAEASKGMADQDIGRLLGAPTAGPVGSGQGSIQAMSLGELFVRSDGYKSIRDPSRRPASWSSGVVEGPQVDLKGTLLEGAGSPGSGSGGAWLSTPQVAPGLVAKLFQALTIEGLLMAGQATGNTVRYAVQGTATSAAAGVAEAGVKPESTLGFNTLDEPIKKVATVLPISDELVEDAPAIQQFINSQLSLFVQIEAERQLFRGTSGGNEVQGILTGRGVPIYAGGTAEGNKATQVFKAINGTRGSAYVEPEWIVMHPDDWEDIRLLTDSAGQYLAGGPFLGPYGTGSNLQASGQVTGLYDTLWNKPVYITNVIGSGTALVGASAAGQVWSKGGPRVEVSNSHSDWFFKDIMAIRCERRLGLTLYRPNAMCEVRLA